MLATEIEKLRKQLNKEAESHCLNDEVIIKTSQKLDRLIIAYYKTKNNTKFN